MKNTVNKTLDDEIKEATQRIKDLNDEQENIVNAVMKIYDLAIDGFSQEELNTNLSSRHKVMDIFDKKLKEQYGSETKLYAETGVTKATLINTLHEIAVKHDKLGFDRDLIKAGIFNSVANYHIGPLKQNATFELSATDTPEARQKNKEVLEIIIGTETRNIEYLAPQHNAMIIQKGLEEQAKYLGTPYVSENK